METNRGCYRGYRFPPQIISHAVWLYYRFSLSLRDVEELLAERGIVVSYETIRQWCRKFGPEYVRTLRRRQGQLGKLSDSCRSTEQFRTSSGWDGITCDQIITGCCVHALSKIGVRLRLPEKSRPAPYLGVTPPPSS